MNITAAAGSARLSVRREALAPARRWICFGLALGAFLFAGARLPAVQLLPDVYGFGADRAINSAGFGTNVAIVHVTNLSDLDTGGATVPGSLRDAVTKTISGSPPRTVVFDVSGTIKLTKALTINKANVTIAGQAAPAPGIALRGAPLNVGANNVLVQHLRIRPGDEWVKASNQNITTNRDAVAIVDGVSNVVFDHCTFAWSLDEMAEGYYAYNNIAFNRCLFAEPLYIATHLDETTFSPNYPQQAESLTPFATSGLPATTPLETIAHALAVDTNYHRVNANSANDYIEYTLSIPAGSTRNEEHILISGIKGPDRGKFRAEVRLGTNPTPVQVSEEFDMYASTETQETFISRAGTPFEFSIAASGTATPMKVRLVVTGQNAASSGFKLGVDQISLSQPHAMGPYFRDGSNHKSAPDNIDLPGRLSIIGSVFAHLQARGPWIASQNFVLANNVFYHRGQQFVMLGVVNTYPIMKGAIVGNTFLEGRNWETFTTSPIKNTQLPSGSQIYVANNDYNSGYATPPGIYNGTSWPSDTTAYIDGMAGFSPASATAAYSAAILNAGAWPGQRDTQENRIAGDISASASITDYSIRQGALKNSVIDAGNWPPFTGTTQVWAEPANPGGMTGNYTNLEIALQQRAAEVEGSPSSPPTPGAYQAESAVLAGGTVIETVNSGYAGTGYVNFMLTSSLTFNNVDGGSGGTKVLRIRNAFNAAGPRTGELVVNGVVQSITFNPTGSFTTWLNKDVTVTLSAGTTNTIILRSTGSDLANVDEMAVLTPGIYQAEAGTLGGGAFVETINAGYHGTGYINFLTGSPTNSTLTFSSVQGGGGGAKTIQVRYALGSASPRTGDLVINGNTQPVTFNPSGAFTTWTTMDLPVTLSSGTSNTIVFKATGQDLANIDEILVF